MIAFRLPAFPRVSITSEYHMNQDFDIFHWELLRPDLKENEVFFSD
jgi:hypothetical protein